MAEGSAPGSALGGGGGGIAPPSAAGPPKRSGMQQLGGLWRLVYSSGFAGKRSTGGRRPGVPISLLPAQFGQVQLHCNEILSSDVTNFCLLQPALSPT